MWTTARRIMVSVGAVLAVSVPFVQLRKECQDSSFYECVGDSAKWALGIGQVPRPPNETAIPRPENVKQVAVTPPKSPSTSTPSTRDRVTTIGTTPARGFMVINSGNDTMLSFYASRCEDKNWGTDRLGSNEVIPPGQRRSIDIRGSTGGCCFDLRARYRDGTKRDLMNVDVCRLTHWTVGNR